MLSTVRGQLARFFNRANRDFTNTTTILHTIIQIIVKAHFFHTHRMRYVGCIAVRASHPLSPHQAQLPPLQIFSAVQENGHPAFADVTANLGIRGSGRAELRNAHARRLRLNLRGCACSKGDSSLLIVCFNQALSQGSGSCRTSGSCHLYRDTQRK